LLEAALIAVPAGLGYWALFGLVLGESAGLPIPGETALIVASGLAASGKLSFPLVILITACAAIIGDTAGYWIGRRGGRKLLTRDGFMADHRRDAVEKADKFFAKYGVFTVFFGRFVIGVRVVAALVAGATHMKYPHFAVANALGAFAWASVIGGIAYWLGPTGAGIMAIVGLSFAGVVTLVGIVRTRRAVKGKAGAESGDGEPTDGAPVEPPVSEALHG
jgi:membrane protein DedA with SNARE-associated domain